MANEIGKMSYDEKLILVKAKVLKRDLMRMVIELDLEIDLLVFWFEGSETELIEAVYRMLKDVENILLVIESFKKNVDKF